MTRLDVKIAVRTIYRNKFFSIINVIGLTLGISVTIVAYLIVSHDFSYERFQKDRDRIYRVVSRKGIEPNILYTSGVPMPLGEEVRTKISGVESVAAFNIITDPDIEIPLNEHLKTFRNQKGVVSTSPDFFKVFSYSWLLGSAGSALGQPYQVVLTRSSAAQFYPGLPLNEVIGRSLIMRDSILTKVSGIIDDLAGNTDLKFKVFVSKATFQTHRLRHPLYSNWSVTIGTSQLFVKLAPGYRVENLKIQLESIYKLHSEDQNDSILSPYLLQQLADVHFDSRYGSYFGNRIANKPVLYGLMTGAFFILILGYINFVNLSVAQSEDRAKEIGIRKTLGSSRKQLAVQFLTETFFMTLLAGVLALLFVPLILYLLGDLVPTGVIFNPIRNQSVLLFLLVMISLTTIVAGIYPAWILSGFSPINILKRKSYHGRSKSRIWIKKSLILGQFAISQAFIIAVVFVALQLRYILKKNLGFRKDAILYFETSYKDTVLEKKAALYNELKSIPEVSNVSLSNGPASSSSTWSGILKYSGNLGVIEANVQQIFADTNFLSLFEIPIVAGRNIQTNIPLKECLINVEYSQVLGFKDPHQAIGITLKYDSSKIRVVGIISNFYQQSLYEKIEPLMITFDPGNQNIYNIGLPQNKNRLSTSPWELTIKKIEKAFRNIYPQQDFSYEFQDETIKQYYKADIRLSLLLKYISILTILLSSIGLFGYTLYLTNKRMKEISIRKVLGASIFQIVRLFAQEFMILILLAFIVDVPITSWFVYTWLNNFSYRISMTWWIFCLGGIIACLLALVIITMQTIRAFLTKSFVFLKPE